MNCSGLLRGFAFGLLLAMPFASTLAAAPAPIIAVASNLRIVIEEVAQVFYKETGQKIRFSFGSSGNLTRQIIQGAPFEMFMSADEGYVFRVSDAGKANDRGKIYAYGRIAAFAPKGSPLQLADFPGGYSAVLEEKIIGRFAIANPLLAPYGRAAKQALEHTGLWHSMQPHLIYGENIAQAAQFALSGSTLGGIIAYAQALSPPFKERGNYQLIPASFHKPLAQRMVLLSRAGDTAKRFYDFIDEKAALEIFNKYGFTVQ